MIVTTWRNIALTFLSPAVFWASAVPAQATGARCDGIDLAGYLQDHDTEDGNFAARIVTLDSGDAVTGLTIHATVEKMLRGSYRGSRIIIHPTHVTDCDLVPIKGEGGVLVGRILVIDEDGIAVIDPLRTETPRQRAHRGDDMLRGAPAPPVSHKAPQAEKLSMRDWDTYRTPVLDGNLVVEFDGTKQAYLSFEHAMSPDDPTDDAKEVILLAPIQGSWPTREDAIVQCVKEGKRLLAERGRGTP